MTGLAETSEREKTAAAGSSVIAAIALTSLKIIVGVATGSLGILAEAAHSGLDLVAALVTFMAVRLSGKPADREHTYGHGKIENLSALFETLLLLATCAWIIYEAVQRLFFKTVTVENSIWSFAVMGVSIVIDYTRSRILYRAARKYNSQALEADALHFSTDIWSSSVVIVGLAGVWIAGQFPALAFLHKADSAAALGVALIVIYVSVELGMRTIQALLDSAPKGMAEKIKLAVEPLPGIANVHDIRLRYSGPHLFVDAHVLVDGSISLDEAHALTEAVELAVRQIAPGADVIVHPEPLETQQPNGGLAARIIAAVETIPDVVDCHDVDIHYPGGRPHITTHVTVNGRHSLSTVHELTDQIEAAILDISPGADVTVHPEPK